MDGVFPASCSFQELCSRKSCCSGVWVVVFLKQQVFTLVDLKIFLMLNFIIPKYKCNFLYSMILKIFKFSESVLLHTIFAESEI